MNTPHLTILGGGIAGLSVAVHARRAGLPFILHEAESRLGGNCITLKHGAFRFDSGAHRFHDKDAGATEDARRLLGDSLKPLVRPFKYYSRGGYLEYPLSPANVLMTIGPADSFRAARDLLGNRARRRGPWSSYEDYAVATYGKTLAGRFLLSYTEKLWGVPCAELELEVAAKRFKGFGPASLALRAFGRGRRTEDCRYYYPEGGIETLAASMTAACGDGALVRNSRLTGVEHDGRRVLRIETEGGRTADVEEVVSTIPLRDLLRSFRPSPPPDILAAAGRLRYRNVALAALFLDRPSVTDAATIYTPDPDLGLIRVYEPRNRDAGMAPSGKTSLVAEYPCDPGEGAWALPDEALISRAVSDLGRMGLVQGPEIIGSAIHRMPCAYPLPDRGGAADARALGLYAASFANLRLSGRCGTHRYLWMHEVMASGRRIVASYLPGTGGME